MGCTRLCIQTNVRTQTFPIIFQLLLFEDFLFNSYFIVPLGPAVGCVQLLGAICWHETDGTRTEYSSGKQSSTVLLCNWIVTKACMIVRGDQGRAKDVYISLLAQVFCSGVRLMSNEHHRWLFLSVMVGYLQAQIGFIGCFRLVSVVESWKQFAVRHF